MMSSCQELWAQPADFEHFLKLELLLPEKIFSGEAEALALVIFELVYSQY